MTTPVPPRVKRHLNVSTCLLLPRTARQVKAELHGNLYQDMLDACCGGLSEPQAWEVALRNAGSAWKAALGLARVHTLGLLVRVLLLGAALGGASYAGQAGLLEAPHAQVGQP